MSLPKINTPEYRLNVPSTDEEIRFRPFLVKEEKVLLVAQETGDDRAIYDAIKNLVESCTFGACDVSKMPLFDLEYIFLNIRAKSVGEVATVEVICQDDNETKVKVEIDLTQVQVQMDEKHDARIQLTDDIGLLMSYPHLANLTTLNADNATEQMNNLFQMIYDCMYQIWQGEETFDVMDYTLKEKKEFIESLNHEQFAKIQYFFESMPAVKHEVEVENPKTKKKSKGTLQGMNSFF